jgi:ABC-type molybdate transport system substrate-binding protein
MYKKNKTKTLRHEEICFSTNKMITLYTDDETKKIYEMINSKNSGKKEA